MVPSLLLVPLLRPAPSGFDPPTTTPSLPGFRLLFRETQLGPTRATKKNGGKKKKEKNFRTRLSSHFFLAFSGPTPNFYSAAAWAKNLNDSGKLCETHCVCANHVFCDPTRGANSSCSCFLVWFQSQHQRAPLGPKRPNLRDSRAPYNPRKHFIFVRGNVQDRGLDRMTEWDACSAGRAFFDWVHYKTRHARKARGLGCRAGDITRSSWSWRAGSSCRGAGQRSDRRSPP